MNHKNGIAKGIFLSLLFGTLFCLLVPIYCQKKTDTVNHAVLSEYNKVKKIEDLSLVEYQKKYNDYLLEKGMIAGTTKPEFTIIPDKEGVIGSIEFPTVRIAETPIYKEESNLSFFHYKYGSFPSVVNSGHFAINVSNRWRDQVNQVELVKLKVGDCFYLKMGNKKIAYQITTIVKQNNQDVRKIAPMSNGHLLTIEMKNLSGFTDFQTAILSKRIDGENVQKATIKPTQKINFSYSTIVITFILFNILFFSGLVRSYQRYVRKAHTKSFRTKYKGYRKLRVLLYITRGYYILLGLIMFFYLLLMIYRFVYLK